MSGTPFFAGLLSGLLAGVAVAGAVAGLFRRRHTLRVRMAERRARAAERMAEIGAMTGGLAHEIKNPLSTIGLNAELLDEAIGELGLGGPGGTGIGEEDRRRLLARTGALKRETERLGGILTDFLQYAGQVKLDRRAVDVGASVEELVDFFLPEAERHGVRVRVETGRGGGAEGASLSAEIDAKAVKQALLNLMLNATQAMQRGRAAAEQGAGGAGAGSGPGSRGELILRTEPGKDADGRRVVRVHVIDTGPGIAPEVLGQIFNPYFTTRSGGSGLGLPTSRRLIEEHGGRIEVSSEVGKGSDFTVVLPVDDA